MAAPPAKSDAKQKSAQSLENTFLSKKFDTTEPQCVPDTQLYYATELRHRLSELNQQETSLFNNATNLFKKIISNEKSNNPSGVRSRRNGEEIASIQPTKENLQIVEKLTENPYYHDARVKLAASVLSAGRDLTLPQRRVLMMHLAMPLAMGNFDVGNVKWINTAHRLYSQLLVQHFQRERIKVKEKPGENKDKPEIELYNKNEAMLSALLARPAQTINLGDMVKSVTRKQIREFLNGTYVPPKGGGAQHVARDMERNLGSMILRLLHVDFLHDALLYFTKETYPKIRQGSALPFLMQGELYFYKMQAASIYAKHGVQLPQSPQDLMKLALAAFGQCMKSLGSVQHLGNVRYQILYEHARVCLITYHRRKELEIPTTVSQKVIASGKRSLDMSGTSMQHDTAQLLRHYSELK